MTDGIAGHPVLCLQHPNKNPGLVLRMGRNKVGHPVLFTAHKECRCPSRWSYFRNATAPEISAFDGIDASELEAFPGPAGMLVYFHKSELQ